MNPDEPTQPAPGGDFARSWLENLAVGLRLAFFLPPGRLRFHVGANHFIAVAATSLALNGACSLVLSGPDGSFNLLSLPSELFWVAPALLAGYLAGRVTQDAGLALLVPIAVGSIGIPFSFASSAFWFAADRGWFSLPAVLEVAGIYQFMFVWWALATLAAIGRLTIPVRGRAISPVTIVAILVLVPSYFVPPEPLWEAAPDPDEAAQSRPSFGEDALYAQQDLLRDAEQRLKPERAGVQDLYFVGFAPYASQDVFMKETLSIGSLLEERFGTGGRAITLISHPGVADRYPIATLTSLREALRAVGERINPDEDVVLLHLTSHGSETHDLSVQFYPLALQPIRPEDVRAALDDARIKWRIVVVSACYSGGFIDALKDAHTLVVTASDAQHTSFGCGNAFDFTYFSKAYYDEALRQTYSFENAYAIAKESVRQRELKEGLQASNPQIFVGQAMHAKLARLEKSWSSGAANAR
jgi:hypothetical protein